MKQSIKFLAFSFFAFCLSFNMNAQNSRANSKANTVKTDKIADKTEKMEKRANKLADKVEMNDDQRARFVVAHVEYSKAVKATRKTKVGKAVKKAQLKELRADHTANLNSFLSDDQMASLKQIAKEKRNMKKGKKNKKNKKNRKAQLDTIEEN